ncbi:hypothetical protein MNBD_UNCLBAC01-1944 [hydrothermal vent metagenome]|uniref:PIN domain-containing protein n=1 Tax=hydrothermal vent metagenome TaxID=652676 RepID=A0A3B1D9W8_9ZZZZ
MTGFIDTSSLFKKYVQEKGFQKFKKVLNTLENVQISPITFIELHKAVKNRLERQIITYKESQILSEEINRDYSFFRVVQWNSMLEKTAVYLVNMYNLKTLDSIQLASGILSEADKFITSDKQLYKAAQKEVSKAILIECY